MSLAHGRVEPRLPVKDLARAKRWYAENLGLLPVAFYVDDIGAEVTELRRRGVVFENDGEDNMLGIGQAIR